MNQAGLKIAISGDLGSGKSTVCRLLQEKLPVKIFSMGEAWRKLAEKYQMTILELNQYSETHPLDEEMDQMMTAMGSSPESMIFDSRLAWHFIPQSFKVHLTVNPIIAAERIFKDQRGQAEGYSSIAEALTKLDARKSSEHQRYLQKYQLNCSAFENYDLVIDTSYAMPQEIATLIINTHQVWETGSDFTKLWLAPKNLYPTKPLFDLEQLKLEHQPKLQISIIKADCHYFIQDGHLEVALALKKELNLIAAHLSNERPPKINPELFKEWETTFNFIFAANQIC